MYSQTCGQREEERCASDGVGVKYNTIGKALFVWISFGDKLKGIEDVRIDLLTCPLPPDLGLLNSVLVSVTLKNVEVVFHSQC
jgi:hypothetical protein